MSGYSYRGVGTIPSTMDYVSDFFRRMAGVVTSFIVFCSRASAGAIISFIMNFTQIFAGIASVMLASTTHFIKNLIRTFEWANRTRNRVDFMDLMSSWTKTFMITFVSEFIMILIITNVQQSSLISFLMKDVLARTMVFILNVVIGVITLFPLILVLTIIIIKTRLSSLELEYRTSSGSENKESDLSWCISFAASVVVNLLISTAVTSVLISTMDFSLTVVLVGTGVLVTHALILPFWRTMIGIVIDMFIRGLLKISGIDGVSSDRKPNHPPGIRKLNKSVWEFHSPKSKTPEVEIVFFHDLQLGGYEDAFWTTWCARNYKKLIWPQDWLSEKIPNARILSISYNSSAIITKDDPTDLYLSSEKLVGDIILDDDYNIGQHCPVFLVGHGLGGVIIKQLVLSAHRHTVTGGNLDSERSSKFLGHLKGVVYYGTPHLGSRLADLANLISYLIPLDRLPVSPIVTSLQSLDTQSARLFEQFRKVRQELKIRTVSMAEGRPIQLKGLSLFKVVTEASARLDSDSYITNGAADHFTVCKPKSGDDMIISFLVRFIDQLVQVNKKDVVIN